MQNRRQQSSPKKGHEEESYTRCSLSVQVVAIVEEGCGSAGVPRDRIAITVDSLSNLKSRIRCVCDREREGKEVFRMFRAKTRTEQS